MLDEGPRQAPFDASPPDPVQTGSAGASATEPSGPTRPAATDPTATGATPAGSSRPAATTAALISADVSDAWARLEPPARLLVGCSLAAILIVLVGLPLSVWDSAPFALLVLVAGIVTAVTGWFGTSPAFRELPVPRGTVELLATHVVTALAVLKAVEILFDLDTDGIVGLVLGGGLVAAAIGQLIAAQRRGADPLAFTRGEQGAKIAAVGLLLVVVGWAFNLSVSFWTMGQAALPLAVLTIAALTVAEAPRIQSPIPVAWVGAGIAGFGGLLALGHWFELTSLGRTELELDPGDFIGLLAYTAGTALIIAGGALSGRDAWTASHPAAPGPIVEG